LETCQREKQKAGFELLREPVSTLLFVVSRGELPGIQENASGCAGNGRKRQAVAYLLFQGACFICLAAAWTLKLQAFFCPIFLLPVLSC